MNQFKFGSLLLLPSATSMAFIAANPCHQPTRQLDAIYSTRFTQVQWLRLKAHELKGLALNLAQCEEIQNADLSACISTAKTMDGATWVVFDVYGTPDSRGFFVNDLQSEVSIHDNRKSFAVSLSGMNLNLNKRNGILSLSGSGHENLMFKCDVLNH
jgi:hypothetical protein